MTERPLRFVTAASLFDGHDAAISIMRRILQDRGCEVIHLGHDRSVADVVSAAIQEDADGIAVSSYQGGHVEYFTYLRSSLNDGQATSQSTAAAAASFLPTKSHASSRSTCASILRRTANASASSE